MDMKKRLSESLGQMKARTYKGAIEMEKKKVGDEKGKESKDIFRLFSQDWKTEMIGTQCEKKNSRLNLGKHGSTVNKYETIRGQDRIGVKEKLLNKVQV